MCRNNTEILLLLLSPNTEDQELNKFDCLRHLFQSQLDIHFCPLCLYVHCNFLKF